MLLVVPVPTYSSYIGLVVCKLIEILISTVMQSRMQLPVMVWDISSSTLFTPGFTLSVSFRQRAFYNLPANVTLAWFSLISNYTEQLCPISLQEPISLLRPRRARNGRYHRSF